jgi:hypothetical protein
MVKLTEVSAIPKIVDSLHTDYTVKEMGPVWVNPLGVNLVAQHAEIPCTSILLDDGSVVRVSELPERVVDLIDSATPEDLR